MLLKTHYPFIRDRTAYTSHNCRRTESGGYSLHGEGRAIDFGLNARNAGDEASANVFLSWLFETDAYGHTHARFQRLGLQRIGYRAQWWEADRREWRPQSSLHGDDTQDHWNHMHIEFGWPGARAETTWFNPGNSGTPPTTTPPTTLPPPNLPPIPVVDYSVPSPVPFGERITLSAAGSSDQDGQIVSYAWAFGDGSTASGAVVTVPVLRYPSFVGTLTVTDDTGLSASTPVSIVVGPPVVNRGRALLNPLGSSALPVYAIDAGGNLLERYFTPELGWSTWGNLGRGDVTTGGFQGSPFVTLNPLGISSFNVYAIDQGGNLLEKYFTPSLGWSTWGNHGNGGVSTGGFQGM
jgi:hypothetical protein